MIHHVDKALETFLRQQVPLPEPSIDVSFRAPEGSWTASAARPTVDVFLWDVARSDRSNVTGLDERVAESGRRQQRVPPRRVTLRYFVTVWAREHRDEHELLGAILRSVLAHDVLPAEALPQPIAEISCRLYLGGDQHRLPPTLWPGAPVKPGLYVEVELGVDATGWVEREAPVEAMRVGVVDRSAHPPAVPEPPDAPPLRRFRAEGALMMEGRPERVGTGAAPDARRGGESGGTGGGDGDAGTGGTGSDERGTGGTGGR